MKKKEATSGTMVDIVPMNGSVSNMATRVTFGKKLLCDDRMNTKNMKGILVQIQTVIAPGLIIPPNSKRSSLGSYGNPPFTIVVPLCM